VRTVKIHETIHGRAYVFEVVSVTPDRWRAQIARRGATTALMPFYGATPVEAARHLAGWLTLAGQKTAGAADPVQKSGPEGGCPASSEKCEARSLKF